MKELLTVLLPVYNSERFLKQAIDSVLTQSFQDFILLIINDGSIDKSKDIIMGYNDERIEYIENESNIGLVKTLNKGLSLVKTKYVARMDADDICNSDRFEIQINYLEKNSTIALVGGWATVINEENRTVGKIKYPSDDITIRTSLLFSNMFIHSSIMLRYELIKDLKYDESHIATEDFGLWAKISQNNSIANLQHFLIEYRINTKGIMAKENLIIQNRIRNSVKVYYDVLNGSGIIVDLMEAELYTRFLFSDSHVINKVKDIVAIFLRMKKQLYNDGRYSKKVLDNLIIGNIKGYFINCNYSMKCCYNMLLSCEYSKMVSIVETAKTIPKRIVRLFS